MVYKRYEVIDRFFQDIFPEGKIYRMPELPKIEFKKDKVHYRITDLRFLNETAINVFEAIMQEVANYPDIDEVKFLIPQDMPEDKINLVNDIIMHIGFEAEKKGKNGFYRGGCLLVMGGRLHEEENGERIVSYELVKDHAKVIYDYAQGEGRIEFFGVIEAIINDYKDRMASPIAIKPTGKKKD